MPHTVGATTPDRKAAECGAVCNPSERTQGVSRTDPSWHGCDELRAWLVEQGFRIGRNELRGRDNECNWYAWRRSELPARECECNEGNPAQLVVWPHRFTDGIGSTWESSEVEVCGQAGGAWFKLRAYGLSDSELRVRLADVERSLIAAWNALKVSA